MANLSPISKSRSSNKTRSACYKIEFLLIRTSEKLRIGSVNHELDSSLERKHVSNLFRHQFLWNGKHSEMYVSKHNFDVPRGQELPHDIKLFSGKPPVIRLLRV